MQLSVLCEAPLLLWQETSWHEIENGIDLMFVLQVA